MSKPTTIKFKHNKRKNTGFLYEVLAQELTKAVVAKNGVLRQKILEIVKKCFSKNSLLRKELSIYQELCEMKRMSPALAEKVFAEIKKEYAHIDRELLEKEQSNLFAEMKKTFPQDIFSTFIPNYRSLATIEQLFNRNISISSRMLLEQEFVKRISSPELKEEKVLVPIDNITLKVFVDNFNKKYSHLHEEQKKLLGKFITSFNNNGLELKLFLNEEIGRLKKEMGFALKEEVVIKDEQTISSVKKVISLLEDYARKDIDREMIENVLKIQNVVREIKTNDDSNKS